MTPPNSNFATSCKASPSLSFVDLLLATVLGTLYLKFWPMPETTFTSLGLRFEDWEGDPDNLPVFYLVHDLTDRTYRVCFTVGPELPDGSNVIDLNDSYGQDWKIRLGYLPQILRTRFKFIANAWMYKSIEHYYTDTQKKEHRVDA